MKSLTRTAETYSSTTSCSGLARSDAERIVRESIRESTACVRDALRVEAEVQAVDYDAVLNAIESTLEA
jgi:hypothetical protein